jgi:hypothetical protein
VVTPDERAALRADHLRQGDVDTEFWCLACDGDSWPCDTVRLLDALDAETRRAEQWASRAESFERERDEARAEVERLREEVALLRDASLRYERSKRRGNYDRIGVDADGYAWRVSGDMWSMVRTTTANGPIPEPVTWYVPELDRDGWRDLFHQAKRANREARAALDRVRALHLRPTVGGEVVGDFCDECDGDWPCATIRAIDGGAS